MQSSIYLQSFEKIIERLEILEKVSKTQDKILDHLINLHGLFYIFVVVGFFLVISLIFFYVLKRFM